MAFQYQPIPPSQVRNQYGGTMSPEEMRRLGILSPAAPSYSYDPSATAGPAGTSPLSFGTAATPQGLSLGTPMGGGSGFNFGLNPGTFGMVSTGLQGLGSLAQGWAAMKSLGIAKDNLAFQKDAFERNFGQQQRAYEANSQQVNNRINDQNAWKTAQGRTDLAKLVV